MKIHNNTKFELSTVEQIAEFKKDAMLLKTVVSKWRQRTIRLYKHPCDSNRVISIGVSFPVKDGTTSIMSVVADEPKTVWRRELAHPEPCVTTE